MAYLPYPNSSRPLPRPPYPDYVTLSQLYPNEDVPLLCPGTYEWLFKLRKTLTGHSFFTPNEYNYGWRIWIGMEGYTRANNLERLKQAFLIHHDCFRAIAKFLQATDDIYLLMEAMTLNPVDSYYWWDELLYEALLFMNVFPTRIKETFDEINMLLDLPLVY